MKDCMNAALRLQKLRLSRQPRLSQKRVADRLGVSRTTYANYEQGRRSPPAWFILLAADYFGVTVEDLYE